MPAPILTSGGAHWIEPFGSGAAASARRLEFVADPNGSPGDVTLATGRPVLVLADVTDSGEYELVTVAAALGHQRLSFMLVTGSSDVLVY